MGRVDGVLKIGGRTANPIKWRPPLTPIRTSQSLRNEILSGSVNIPIVKSLPESSMSQVQRQILSHETIEG
jgi:hypothetical protein